MEFKDNLARRLGIGHSLNDPMIRKSGTGILSVAWKTLRMTSEKQGQITQLLARWAAGDRSALDSLTPVVYGELRKIAESYLRRERKGHTLQPTALVNDSWLRLARAAPLSFESRQQFFGLAAQVMRQVLVDYARGARASKRGGGQENIPLNGLEAGPCADLDQFLALDQAIDRLAAFSPRQARIVELRYFGGLNGEEMADLLDVSQATISREQKSAEAWLSRAMASSET
jgi:RNA polymerase sigma-70 factor, ECF subfamily